MPVLVDERRLLLRVAAPQHEDDRFRPGIDDADDGVGEPLPAAVPMRGGAAHFDRQYAVQQQHALRRPMLEEAMPRWADAEVALQLLEDVDEARRRADIGRHREAEAMRLALAMVGILAEDDDA